MSRQNRLLFGYFLLSLVAAFSGYQFLNHQTSFLADAEEVQEYSDEITNVATRIEGNEKVITEYHDKARIPFITVYRYPLDETGAAAVPPAQQVGGTNYYRVTSTNTDEDSGDEVCAIATGSACTGYVDESVTGFNVCTAYNPTAATVTDVNGDGSVTYCDGAPQTGPCASLTNTCLACPDCVIGVSCGESIGNLYREMYVTCAAASTDVGLNGGTTSLSTSSDLSSQVSVLGSGQGAYNWEVDSASFYSLNIPFDSGVTQTDFSGTAASITAIDAPTLITSGCKVGVCYQFDGINDQWDTNVTLASIVSNHTGTMSAWVRPTGTVSNVTYAYSGDQVISNSYIGGISRASIAGQDRIWVYHNDGNEDRVGADFTLDQWTHIVWVHVGGKIQMYKDGVFVGETETGNTQLTNQEVRIGGAGGYGAPFAGYIDEVQTFPIALSPSQIDQLYTDTAAGYAGPRVIHSEHTNGTEVWDLDVVSIGTGGAIGATTASTNTVTINADAITVQLNSGVSSLDTYTNLVADTTGIASAGAAYTWTENTNPHLSLYYPMNSGASAQDFSGNSRTGVVSGQHFSPQWQGECQVGGCLYFDGTGDQIDTNLPLSSFMSDTQGSISVWVKPTGAAPVTTYAYSGDQVFSSSYVTGLSQANIAGEDRLWAYHSDANEDRIGTTYIPDEWTHLVWVFGGGRLRLYQDGSLIGSVETGNTQLMNQEVRIGWASGYGSAWQGYIDELQVYDFALSEDQVVNLFNDGDANNPGPTEFDDFELNAGDVFDLTVTPLEQSGAILAGTASSNNVTISDPTPSLALNLGGATLSTFSNLSSVATGLDGIRAAYNWSENGASYMQLNMPFNNGDTLFDYSGNSRNGVRIGAAFSPREQGLCKVGGCLFFDGVNDQVDMNIPLSTIISNNEGTYSVWVRPTGTAPVVTYAYSGDQVISSSYLAGLSQASIGGEDRLWAYNYDTAEDRIGATYTPDEWTHLVWVHGGGQLLFYKDGVLVGSTASGNTQVTNQEVRIGFAGGYGGPWQGYIDEVQAWNFALSSSQIDQLYIDGDAGLSGPTIIRSPETVGGDTWEVSMTPIEEDSADLSVVNAGTTVTITVPPTSLNLNGGNISLSTTGDLVPTISGIGDPQAGLTWEENGAPYLTLNYPFNLGATQYDYSGNAYDGTVIQAAFSPQGQGFCQVGGCLFFDGIDDQIDTNQPLSSFISDTQGTFSAWVRPTGTAPVVTYAYSGDQVISSSYLAGLSQADIGGEDRLWAYNYDTAEDRIGATYTPDEWTHLVWVHSGGELRFYKDSVLVGSIPSGNTQLTNQEVRIGFAGGYGGPWQGYIDEVQAWDFGLTVSQIEQLYTDGAANVAGPSQITSSETIVADVWDLDVTAFKGDGSPLSTTPSTNTVTIAAPSVTVQINGGSNIIDPAINLTSSVTGLGPSAAAYEWELNSGSWMTLNIPYNPGSTQVDYSGNNYDATTTGAAYSIEAEGNCKVGGCHFYDGVNDQEDVNQPLSALITAGSGTMSVWVRPIGGAPVTTYAYSGDQVISSSYLAGLSQANIGGEDRLWAYNYDTAEDRIGAPYTPNEWTHLVWVHDAGLLSFYKDGGLVGSTPSGDTQLLNQEVRIGWASGYGGPWQGYIDEVQTWNFGLSPDQISILYANGVAGEAGPKEIADEHINLGDTWNLIVTPFESDGTPFAPNNSGNTTTGFINTPPNTPVRVSPADGLTTVELSPELSVNYTDINAGHVGTTEYRVSTGSLADCINNVNVVDTGTSATTATINEDTVYTVGVVLADFTTYTWCARNYDTFDYSNGGAFSGMGEFTVDTTYNQGGKIRQIQQSQPDPTPDSTDPETPTEGDSTPTEETPTEEDPDGDSNLVQPEDSTDPETVPEEDTTPVDEANPEGDSTPTEETTPQESLPQEEVEEAPGDGQEPPAPSEPTTEESNNIDLIVNELINQEAQDTSPETQPEQTNTSVTEGQVTTDAQSDGRSFTIEVADEGDADQVGDEQELVVTGLASTEADRIEFTGTTSQPNTTVLLIFNDGVTVSVTSDDTGFWQTFVSAEQLKLPVGQESQVQVEAIASKDNLTSSKVAIARLALEVRQAPETDTQEVVAEFQSIFSESELITDIQAVTKQVEKVIEEQEEVIQQTLTVAAPVVIVSSAPLWGYLPYLPTIVYHLITYLVGLIGRRKQEENQVFGTVYDAITKRPLGLSVIRVYKKQGEIDHLVTTKVSDKFGRYDLLLEPGEYRLEAKKPQYTFPSKIESFTTAITITEEAASAPDIPLDPVHTKKQFAAANILKKMWLSVQAIGQHLAVPVLFVGAIASILTVMSVPESPENWLLAMVYVFLLVLQLRLRPVIEKAWGVVYDLATNAVLPLTTIQLIEPEYGKVVSSRLTDYEGRFAFLPEPGNYLLKAVKQGYDQVEVEEGGKAGRDPVQGEVSIRKEGESIRGDIPMKQL